MKVKAYKPYNARKANELSLNVDDIIEVEDKTSIDLWKGKLEKSGESGLFPTNCVVPVDGDATPPPLSNDKSGFVGKKPDLLDNLNDSKKNITSITPASMPFKQLKQVTTGRKDPTPVSARPPPLESTLSGSVDTAPKLPPKPVREQARVIYGYKAQNEDELSIKEGDIITVISKDNEDVGWWKGELNGRIALFPDNFVEVIQPSPPPPLPRPADNEKLKIRKPDRGSPTVNSTTAASNSTSPAPANDSAASNAFASVPIIGKMIKFGTGNQSTVPNHPKSSTDTPAQSVTAVSSVNGQSKASDLTCDSAEDSAKEDSFNAAEPLSPSKLVHLTAQRPKIPSNQRRPPSLHLGKSSEFPDFMETMEESNNSPSEQQPPKKLSVESKIAPNNVALKPVNKPELEAKDTSPEKKAPWLSELKKSQERRRTNELLNNNVESNRKSLNGPPAPTPSTKPHAPTPPTGKPFVSNSTKPSLVSAQTASTAPAASLNSVPSSADHSSEASPIGTKSVSSSAPVSITTITTTSNSTSESALQPPVTVQPVSHQPSITSVTSSSNSDVVTIDAKTIAARDAEMTKMRNELNDLTETVAELRTTVTELRKELHTQTISQKSQVEWAQQKAELEKQIHEQQNNFESHKKNLSDVVKELINELAEEKKKIAALQIEFDRMRKLTTTTV